MKLRAIILDTVRQTVSRGTLLFYFGLSAITIIVLSFAFTRTTVDGNTVISLFGNAVPAEQADRFLTSIQVALISMGYAGLLILGVISTSGILPDLMQRGTIDLYLSKPIGRPFILLGKYLGGLSAIVANICFAVAGLWLMFGLKTGIWNFAFLYSAVTLSFSFAVLLCYMMLLALIVRSSLFVVIVSFFYIFILDAVLYKRIALEEIVKNGAVKASLDGLYYALPQLSDLQANTVQLVSGGSMTPYPFYYSAASGVAALILALILFNKKDF